MLRALNKLSGAVAAAILYPIKSAIVNTLFILATFILAAILIVGFPIAVAIRSYTEAQDDKLANAIVGFLLMSAVALIIGLPIAIIVLVVEAIAAFNDFINNFITGITEGYEKGLFFHVTKQILFKNARFSTFLSVINNFVINLVQSAQEQQPMDSSGFADLFEEQEVLEDFVPLSEEELAAAQKKDDLKDILAGYTDLNDRLTNLDEAIVRRADRLKEMKEAAKEEDFFLYTDDDNIDVIEDELKRMEITTPILVVKVFENSHGQWKSVSGTTKIGDKTSLGEWIVQEANVYPPTREPMDDATPHEGKKAKYVITEYTSKKDSKELVEAAKFIRKELNRPAISLQEASNSTISYFNHRFTQLLFSPSQNDTAAQASGPSDGYQP
jgi:hypothetical protein